MVTAQVVAKPWALVRKEVSTKSEHVADLRRGRVVYAAERVVVAETGSVRLRLVAPLKGWVSEKVLTQFSDAKAWRASPACLDARHVVAVRSAGKKGTGVYATKFIPKGSYVGGYVGDLIDEAEYDRR